MNDPLTTEQRFTPGPWVADRYYIVRRSDGKAVAEACRWNKDLWPDIDIDPEANARLIAAAPQLLAAAQNALHYMRLHKYADQAWAEDLEAAITKATKP